MKNKRQKHGKWWFLFLAVSMVSLFYSPTYAASAKADMVLINGKVLTVDKKFSIKEAIAVKGDRIVHVGMNRQIRAHIGKNTKVIDLEGKTILPGINDSHGHVTELGASMVFPDLILSYPNVKTIADIQDLVATRVAEEEDGVWIRGSGWDPAYIEDCVGIENECLNKEQLDVVSTNNPVIFYDFSGHNIWVNSMALELAGVDKDTPDVEGGEIVRDIAGNPTGIFRELAAMNLILKVVPLLTKEELREACLVGMKEMNRNGITSYTEGCLGPGHDTYGSGGLGSNVIEVYKDLHDEGKLTARVSVMISFVGVTYETNFDNFKNNLEAYDWPEGYNSNWLRFPGIKLFADGIPPTETAWMWDEYLSGGYGTLLVPGETDEEKIEEFTKIILYAHNKGFQVGIHATGDRAISTSVDAYEAALKQFPRKKHHRRHYIIHGDFVSPEDAIRLAKIKCGVNMQPYIQTLIADIEPFVVGPERAGYEWPFKTAIDAGIPLTFSSDTAVTYPNWRQGVQSAITRE